MNGILLVDKGEGMTSAGVIRALKPRLGDRKVGHLGTLDPFASGLLPLCLGEATKIARWLLLERKAYGGTIRLGSETDTLDRTGRVTVTAPVPAFDDAMLVSLAERFTGALRQVPPMYSALKRDGVPLYTLARRGLEVERQAREVTITRLVLARRDPERVDFAVECSKGTYVRVLAADLGRALGTAAHLERLRRTAVGAFRVDDALAVEAVLALPPGAPLPVVGVRQALAQLRAFPLGAETVARLRHGQQAALAVLPAPRCPDESALGCDPRGEVVALLEAGGAAGGWRLARLLAPQ
jgi:tRNA pseudouridine55 synthase